MSIATPAPVILLANGHFDPHAQANLIAPALVLASSGPSGIDGAMGIEVTIRKKDFRVEIYDLDHLKTSKTVH